MEQLTIYIAGKVTGEDYKHCVAKFATAQRILEAEGYKVVNPIELVPAGTEWEQAMSICLNALSTCDGLLLLPDWIYSEGAQMERDFAIMNNIDKITMVEFSLGNRFEHRLISTKIDG